MSTRSAGPRDRPPATRRTRAGAGPGKATRPATRSPGGPPATTRWTRTELAATVAASLRALNDPTRPDTRTVARDLETALRAAVEQYRLAPDRSAAGPAVAQAAAAARTACAHLAAEDLVDAYLALRTAHDTLRQPTD